MRRSGVAVARGMLAHRTAAEIAEELTTLPARTRPADCSPATVVRGMRAIREEWARERMEVVDRLVGEDLRRFAELEAVVLPKCREGNGEAMDRWLRPQAARTQRLGARQGTRTVAAGVAIDGTAAGGPAIEVRVRYVDDWREVRGAAMGATVLEGIQ